MTKNVSKGPTVTTSKSPRDSHSPRLKYSFLVALSMISFVIRAHASLTRHPTSSSSISCKYPVVRGAFYYKAKIKENDNKPPRRDIGYPCKLISMADFWMVLVQPDRFKIISVERKRKKLFTVVRGLLY